MRTEKQILKDLKTVETLEKKAEDALPFVGVVAMKLIRVTRHQLLQELQKVREQT